MRTELTPYLVLVALTAMGVRCVAAQAPTDGVFERYDRDANGKVTPQELPNPRTFERFDVNRDGAITQAEYNQVAGGAAAGGAGQADTAVAAYHREGGGPVPLSANTAFTDLRFSRDWTPGTEDRNGKLMTGTECNYLVAHGSRLYAAISLWNHDPAAPNPGPGVLVKPSAAAPWEVDVQFPPPSLRVAVLASLTFATDAEGRKLDPPVSLLVAGGSLFESRREVAVFVRDDTTGRWHKSVIAGRSARDVGEVRLLRVHRDKVTGVDRVIGAVTNGNVYSAVYDPSAPGRIRWNSEPELAGRLARIMSCGEANGDAYLAVDITPDAPKNGGLFRRVDGPQPRWEWIGEWGHRRDHRGVAWVRGLTAIPDPQQPGKERLLCSREVDGVIEVVDPQRNHEPRVEFDLRRHFGGLVGAQEGQLFTTLFAYNEMTPAVHPDTGEPVLLIAGGIMPGLPGNDARAKGAWYLVRHADGRYGTGQVFDPAVVPLAVGGLRSVRTICVSPFPEEEGRVFYFGGFDAARGPHRDTAWIYEGALPPTNKGKP
jgi:hypothetical protein